MLDDHYEELNIDKNEPNYYKDPDDMPVDLSEEDYEDVNHEYELSILTYYEGERESQRL